MKIIYYKSYWFENIGNAVIDMGGVELLKQAIPGVEINFVGDPHYTHIKEYKDSLDKCNIGDYFVFAGCCLEGMAFRGKLKIFRELKKANPCLKYIILGGGAWNYPVDLVGVRRMVKEEPPFIFISRDDLSYKIGEGLAEYYYPGIDTGFYVSDCYKPLKKDSKYIVVTKYKGKFDDEGLKVIQVCHNTKEFPEDSFVSTRLEDYLDLYANAYKVYSRKVHACVMSFSYGRPALLSGGWYERATLFKKIGIDKVWEMSNPNMDRIKEEKEKQVKFLREALK